MDDEKAVKILIELELYKYIKIINENYTGKEAEKLIKEFTEDFKETILKQYSVEDIDGLINSTLNRMDKKERNSR